ncbi:poly-beta-1,6-N-acetyl-D-glucosamine synthase [Bacillus sp. FJAT-51639]|uniref:Poly-beta-1,6-N-acetyl-D-glucosamine synthase n=1 Tax=Bacillus bruguierae TaxID=3127667 RepID=A0ABU8FGR7_9BACI
MMSFLSEFVIWYPICMSIIWMMGAIIFYICIESKQILSRDETPFVSILIPCYNEEHTIRETIDHVMQQKYPHYEVIVINDGSTDQTVSIVKQLIDKYPNLRCINVKKNFGKANALHAGLLASKGDFLVCIDADAILDVHALQYMIPHFSTANQGDNIGAVTGNPRVRNRNNLLSKIQISEFSSIVGMIKRTQSIYGSIMTVSGVVVAFRKQALLDCQLWDRDILTEDIAVTWKLQKKGWQIKYEPRAICWMLVPETLYGLWKQRVRWAQGGLEVLIKHRDIFLNWKYKSLYIIYIEQLVSIVWSIVWFLMSVTLFINISFTFDFLKLFTVSSGILSMICVFQFFIAIMIDKKYDVNLIREYLWAAWYPICYWYINVFVILMAIMKVLTKQKGKFAVWESPDRGLQQTK